MKEVKVDYSVVEALTLSEIVEEYQQADIVTLVSTNEGFGMPIVEAQWMERVVITSSVSSMPEVAGNGALFVNPFDVADIRAGLLRLMEDAELRSSLIEQGRINRARFEAEKVSAQYAELYRRVFEESQTFQTTS